MTVELKKHKTRWNAFLSKSVESNCFNDLSDENFNLKLAFLDITVFVVSTIILIFVYYNKHFFFSSFITKQLE